MTLVWLNRPIMESRVSLVQLPLAIVVSMSWSHSWNLCGVRKIRNLLVSMSHPRIIFRSSSFPSALCFVMLMMSSLRHASLLFFGRNIVSRIRGIACLIRSMLSAMSRHPWKRSSMKLSVQISRAGRVTLRSSAGAWMTSSGSLFGGKSRLKLECSVFGSQLVSVARSCATSATASLTVLNFDGAGDDPKGNRSSR